MVDGTNIPAVIHMEFESIEASNQNIQVTRKVEPKNAMSSDFNFPNSFDCIAILTFALGDKILLGKKNGCV